jgi:O-antigen ligase
MNRERLDGVCEKGILALVLAILVYSPLATGTVRPQDFLVVQWLTVAALALWGLRVAINPACQVLWPPVCWPVLAFLIYAVARYLTADVEFLARQELIKILVYGSLFFAILNNLHQHEMTRIVGLTLVILAVGIALYAAYQFITESDYVWHFRKPAGYHKRGSGTFICPNHGAGYLEMIFPLALAYTLRGQFSHLAKVFLGYAAFTIFVGIAVTLSRGGWAATVLAVTILVVWLVRQRMYRLQAFLLVCALGAAAAGFFFKAELSRNRYERLTWAGNTEDVRFKLWLPAYRIWQDHFWFGAGPAHFDSRYPQYRPPDVGLQDRPDRVHNDYLNTLVDLGLIGGLLVLITWTIFFVEIIRNWQEIQWASDGPNPRRENRSSFLLGGALGLFAILVHSLVDFNMHIPANAILAVTLLALVSGHFRFARKGYWRPVRGWLRASAMAALIVGGTYLAWQSIGRTVEMYWLLKADSPRAQVEPLVALKKAFEAQPKNYETAHRIGETLRSFSAEGQDGYQESAQEALTWFLRANELNPYDPGGLVGAGLCLDWLKRYEEAKRCFNAAYRLDPNGYQTLAYLGWHYVQVHDYRVAKKWFERSLALRSHSNIVASTYLAIAEQRLAEPEQEK